MAGLIESEQVQQGRTGKDVVKDVEAIEDSTDINIKLSSSYRFKVDTEAKVATWVGPSKPISHTWSMLRASQSAGALIDRNQRYELDGTGRVHVTLPVGVTVVLGKAGSGKTRFAFDHLFMATAARDQSSVRFIKFFEPGDSRVIHESVRASFVEHHFEHQLAASLVDNLLADGRELTIVDSLRYLFYSSGSGATGKGGVNMGLFMDLTLLDILFSEFNKRLVVLVNPLTDDEDAFAFYREAAVGSVSAVMTMETPTTATYTNRYMPDRAIMKLSFPSKAFADAYDDEGPIKIAPRTGSLPSELFDRKL